MITRSEVLELAKQRHEMALSIYIPTHRAGQEVINDKDRINFKNQIQDVRLKLESLSWKANDINNFLKPVEQLEQDEEFWRHQSDGLVVFRADDVFEHYSVPIHFEAFYYLNHEFYTKPLMPLFNGECLFYVLSLKKDEVKLYEGIQAGIAEIKISDLTPDELRDRVGYDYEEKHLGVRSQQGESGSGAMYHGYGDGKDDEKEELRKYFRAVDEGVMKLLHDVQEAPLVLACVDHYYPLYKEVCTHHNLYPKHIRPITTDYDPALIHERAQEVLKPYFEQHKKEQIAAFKQWHGTGKASADMEQILPEALAGRVEALFVRNKAEVFGEFKAEEKTVTIQVKTEVVLPHSLLNELTSLVFEKGGSVYLLDKENMPDGDAVVNAVYRY